MADVNPFRGLRYDLGQVGDLSDVTAPPYDVISPQQQKELYELHPCNVIRLILNRDEPGEIFYEQIGLGRRFVFDLDPAEDAGKTRHVMLLVEMLAGDALRAAHHRQWPLDKLSHDKGVSVAQLSLAWLLKRSPVMIPIPGTSKVAHVEENIAARDVELDDETFQALSALAS